MTPNTMIPVLSVVTSWLLAIFLVVQLLSGTFDGRSCQTTCVNTVFWRSFAVAALGMIFSASILFSRKSGWINNLCLLALLGLCGIYVATILIGTFGI